MENELDAVQAKEDDQSHGNVQEEDDHSHGDIEEEDDRETTIEKESLTVEFLRRAIDTIPSNYPGHYILKTHYLNRCLDNHGFEEISLHSLLAQMCKYCSYPQRDGCYKMKVLPHRTIGKRMRKLLKKSRYRPESLTKIEKKLLKRCEKEASNKLKLMCLICGKATVRPMQRTLSVQQPVGEATRQLVKRKKKDRFAGLRASAVLRAAAGMGVAGPSVADVTANPLRRPSTHNSTIRKHRMSELQKIFNRTSGTLTLVKQKTEPAFKRLLNAL